MPSSDPSLTASEHGQTCPFCRCAVPADASVCSACGANKTVALAGWPPLLLLAWLAVLFAMGVGVVALAEWGWKRAGWIGVVFAPTPAALALWLAIRTTVKRALRPRWSR